MNTWSVNRTTRELSAPLTEGIDERGAACKWFAAAILASVVVLTIAVLALALPEAIYLPSCQYYESQKIVVFRDVSALSGDVKSSIVHAYKQMKLIPSVYDSSKTAWDYFVHIYSSAVKQNVTSDWRFLPWQREFGIRFRKEMARAVGKDANTIRFGYWNWSNPVSMSTMNDLNFLGGDGDPEHGCVVHNGNFTIANGWNMSIRSVFGEDKGLLRCLGNGLQFCQTVNHNSSASHLSARYYLLDTVFNNLTVDDPLTLTVGPFFDIDDNMSSYKLTPNASNQSQKWDDPTANRYYYGEINGSMVQLQCRHYGGGLPAHNTTDYCKTLKVFGSRTNSPNFASCVIGLDSSDPLEYAAEQRGISLRPLYGAVRAYYGGSLSGITPANDPFFPHILANIDRMWVEFQNTNPKQSDTFMSSMGTDLLNQDIPTFVGTSYQSILDTREKFYTYDTLCTDHAV